MAIDTGPLRVRWLREILPARGPARILCAGAFGTAIGDGAWYTSWAIYFTRIIHLPAAQVGIALTGAGALALLIITPVGHLGDLLGLKGTLVAALATQAAAMACFALVGSFWSLLAIAAVATSADLAASGLRDALVSQLNEGQGRFSILAPERSAHQLGFTVGAGLGALVLAFGTRPVFLAVILLNSVTSLLYSLWLLRLPRLPSRQHPGNRWKLTVLRDGPYLAVISLTAVLALCWGLLSTGIPLWITHHTHAHLSLAAVIIMINTLGIAIFQVRVSRNNDQPRNAARKAMYSGAALAVSCLLFAFTYQGSGWLETVLLFAGGLAELVGELFFVAALWGLSVGLRPSDSTAGQYQGVATTGLAATQMLSPVIMVTLLVTLGQPGWYSLAGLFMVAGGLVMPAAGWAVRYRPTVDAGHLADRATSDASRHS
jgi:Major Facilitator Superfamily